MATRGAERIIGGITGFCVDGYVGQEHTNHRISTMASDCNYARSAWHAHYQEYYRQRLGGGGAQYCFTEGWHQSPDVQGYYDRHYFWDIWYGCKYGGGVNVQIYVDSWQYSWHDWHGWIGGAWRPATKHCHCP